MAKFRHKTEFEGIDLVSEVVEYYLFTYIYINAENNTRNLSLCLPVHKSNSKIERLR